MVVNQFTKYVAIYYAGEQMVLEIDNHETELTLTRLLRLRTATQFLWHMHRPLHFAPHTQKTLNVSEWKRKRNQPIPY